ncbi:helix-turn-helix transcriptional regulator [Paenibacillus paeoniae]|uniref:Transcriptional regulator n=1 Tax=Paenibacillus paeoniae TaxID=2292705 RepID=A0A371P6I0_9BACL|nr:helix-turn-helix transcriptional regulator [Paenibacillus paeoniae]REK71551.1 transcriptional regulator [Paenibacillus paeoniae]
MKNHIRTLRNEHGMTQEQLGEIVGVSRQSVIAIETMKYNPSLELAYKIAKAFNMQIEEVFVFEDKEEK